MKRERPVLTIATAAILAVVLAGCLHAQRSLSPEKAWERFVGAWVNTEYAGRQPYVQQLVLRPDLVGEDWDKPADTHSNGAWKVTPKKAWTDGKGNTYLQYYFRYIERYPGSGVALMRVDRARKTLELNSLQGSEAGPYPEEIDPGAVSSVSFYFIYYRQ